MSERPGDAYLEYVRARLPVFQRLAYMLCQDRDRADDLVQDSLERLYLKWDKADDARNTDAYARQMLVRVFLSERRTPWARRVVLVDRFPDAAGAAGPGTAATLAVRAALAQLPPRQRAVLVLRFFSDLPVDEVAETLGCSPGTVKSQTSKGLAALRRALPDFETTAPAGLGTRS
ncbi:SigE family RNA polymerase sigma factor [Cryptosporangium phraense]|uniref:SigE family RNA polymerase sigma factor n=1 Tax=Cryptosporangium phraense TaxID=2593070 RepID=A0A545AZR7_9ACTN|nr:SigE family RNA polymerase sigma factor [Cryptosporangium phraense]TQS46826.1 SigE family RNA polymerase sigma factor [Cryptosporangium phraense]